MAWNESQYALVIKAIGTVESNLDYSAINFNDPITVGVAQWFGSRAAHILNRIRTENSSSWTGVASSIAGDVTTVPSTNSGFWSSRYLTQVEGNSLKPVLAANKDIQDDQFSKDIDDYLAVGRNWGLDPDNNFKAVAFWCTMYHQSPLQSKNVLDDVGVNATLIQMYNGALRNNILSRYKTRQQTVYQIIAAGKVSDDDPDTDPGTVPLPDREIEVAGARIKEITLQGDQLILNTDAGKIFAYPSTAQRWIPRANSLGGGTVVIPGDPGGIPDPTDPDPGEIEPGDWHNPLDNQRCTNRFGALSYTSFHSGIDLGAKTPGRPGDPVYAVHGGRVVRTGKHGQVLYLNSGRGIILDIGTHGGDRMYVYYGHLSTIDVAQGATVQAGQKIATMGGTGANDSNSDFAIHLHLVVFKNATINPSGPTTTAVANFLDPETYLKSKGLLQSMNACPYN